MVLSRNIIHVYLGTYTHVATCYNACITATPLLRPQMASPKGGRNRGVLLYIQRDLGKLTAFYHLELAQLWRYPVMWCTVWKGTAQDCIDHMRRIHKVPLSVKAANLARFFPPWTVTREQWADMMMPSISGVVIDMLLFSHIG